MLQRKDNTLRTCKELLLEFNKEKIQVNSSKLKFSVKQTKVYPQAERKRRL